MGIDCGGDRVGEFFAVDGERRTGGHAALFGDAHDQRAEPPHLLFEETHRVIELVAAEGVAAHQLGEPVGLVDRSRPNRPHLVERDRNAARRCLPGGLAPGEPTTNDSDGHYLLSRGPDPRSQPSLTLRIVIRGAVAAQTTTEGSGWRRFELFAAHVIAVLIVAEHLTTVLLRRLLDEVRSA